jgi:hypothetical protein
VTAYATVVAYGRASFGKRLLNEFCNIQIFSSNDSLSLIYAGVRRLGDCGLNEHSL